MRFSTPSKFMDLFYIGLNTFAGQDDEMFGISIGRLYFGIYPIRRGYDLSIGIVDEKGCLN